MTPPDADLTPLAVAVAGLTVLLGPQMAMAVGAYSIILLGWLGGVMVGAYRMPPGTRLQLAAFVAVSLVAVLGVTVPLATVVSDALRVAVPWMDRTDHKALLFPVAFLLPAVGHSWLEVGRWVWEHLQKRVSGAPTNHTGRDGGPQS